MKGGVAGVLWRLLNIPDHGSRKTSGGGGSPTIMIGCFLLAGVKERRADNHVGS